MARIPAPLMHDRDAGHDGEHRLHSDQPLDEQPPAEAPLASPQSGQSWRLGIDLEQTAPVGLRSAGRERAPQLRDLGAERVQLLFSDVFWHRRAKECSEET